MLKWIKSCSCSLFMFFLVCTSALQAEDIEIYAASNAVSASANVLFILDTSTSMNDSHEDGRTRLESLRLVMLGMLRDLKNVNVGIMQLRDLNNRAYGGEMLFPITPIDAPIGGSIDGVIGESESTYFAYLLDETNDATEYRDTVELIAPSAVTVEPNQQTTTTTSYNQRISSNGRDVGAEFTGGGSIHRDILRARRDVYEIGLRFSNINRDIRNADIASATLRYNTHDSYAINGNFRVRGEDSDNPGNSFSNFNNFVNRSRTSASSLAYINSFFVRSANISVTDIVQEIVSRNCSASPGSGNDSGCTFGTGNGASSNDMVFFMTGPLGNNRFFDYNDDQNKAMRLSIQYRQPGAPLAGGSRLVGVRFSDVRIPQGVTINRARLILTPDQTSTDPRPIVNWRITAEDRSDASEFEATNRDLSDRPKTAPERWLDVPQFVAGEEQELDITPLLHRVVNHPNWCGGNNAAFFIEDEDSNPNLADTVIPRSFYTYEGNSNFSPRIVYEYSSTPGHRGCTISDDVGQLEGSADDAVENISNIVSVDLNELELSSSSRLAGFRFNDIRIPQGARIQEAYLELTPSRPSSGAGEFIILGSLNANPPPFQRQSGDISTRPFALERPRWYFNNADGNEDWQVDSAVRSPNIALVIEEIVNQPAWSSGNELVLVVVLQNGVTRHIRSYDFNPAQSARLRVRYQHDVEVTGTTARDKLIEIVTSMRADASTPMIHALEEAAYYWRGEEWGRYDPSTDNQLVVHHPGVYCQSVNGALDCGTVNAPLPSGEPNAEFGWILDPFCNLETNPNSSACQRSLLSYSGARPEFISPFTDDAGSCGGGNYQIILSDGQPNDFDPSSSKLADRIRSLVGSAYSGYCGGSSAEQAIPSCAPTLTRFLFEQDQSATLNGIQNIATSTIGFGLNTPPRNAFERDQLALARQLMRDIALNGGGRQYSAETTAELASAFSDISSQFRSPDGGATFAAPSIATNAFNRLLSRDSVYYGLFAPGQTSAWLGNLKKYQICLETTASCDAGELLDQNGNRAVDSNNRFDQSAQSFWSNNVDGNNALAGGGAAEITDYTMQTIYTDRNASGMAPSGTRLSDPGFQLDSNNWDRPDLQEMRNNICPDPSNTLDCEARMLWLLGKSATPARTDISTTQRWSMDDVLHSSPVLVTYGGRDTNADGVFDELFDKIIFGTNAGVLHFVNGATGVEEWRYMPSDFWSLQQNKYLNAGGAHTYGLDLTPTIQTIDNNNNGIIEPNDSDLIRLFIGSRRGGQSIYALDITGDTRVTQNNQSIVPKFLWEIDPSRPGFQRLGQTWSRLVLARVNIGGVSRDVLIFGGGYDPQLDDQNIYHPADAGGNDFMGNAVYIVDPSDGNLILSISGNGSGADIEVPNMSYPIPAGITLLDSNGDSITDRLYFGDTGGQVWRVDLSIDSSTSNPQGDTIVGLLADVSETTPDTQRRIFESVSVVQVRDDQYSDTLEYDYVLFGTGYRAHPLNLDVQDRFYAFRDRTIFGLSDADGDNLAESADNYPQNAGNAYTNSGLIDVTNQVLDGNNPSHTAADGWYYDFTGSGEKVLSSANTTAGTVLFTSYSPDANAAVDPCVSAPGVARAYNLNILSTSAALDWDADGTTDPIDDRSLELGGGIPSDVVPVFTKEGVVGIVGIEGGAAQLGQLSGIVREQTYWYEEI